ncbi:hypothetical protein PLEOSDRAFT_1088296, partial [Pleurotus ostreatus PC15]
GVDRRIRGLPDASRGERRSVCIRKALSLVYFVHGDSTCPCACEPRGYNRRGVLRRTGDSSKSPI